jgi:hypothetical protein
MTGPVIHYITDDTRKRRITYETFRKVADLDELRREDHPALWRIADPTNWARPAFFKSKLPSGKTVYYFDWSRMEHLFVERPRSFDLLEEDRLARGAKQKLSAVPEDPTVFEIYKKGSGVKTISAMSEESLKLLDRVRKTAKSFYLRKDEAHDYQWVRVKNAIKSAHPTIDRETLLAAVEPPRVQGLTNPAGDRIDLRLNVIRSTSKCDCENCEICFETDARITKELTPGGSPVRTVFKPTRSGSSEADLLESRSKLIDMLEYETAQNAREAIQRGLQMVEDELLLLQLGLTDEPSGSPVRTLIKRQPSDAALTPRHSEEGKLLRRQSRLLAITIDKSSTPSQKTLAKRLLAKVNKHLEEIQKRKTGSPVRTILPSIHLVQFECPRYPTDIIGSTPATAWVNVDTTSRPWRPVLAEGRVKTFDTFLGAERYARQLLDLYQQVPRKAPEREELLHKRLTLELPALKNKNYHYEREVLNWMTLVDKRGEEIAKRGSPFTLTDLQRGLRQNRTAALVGLAGLAVVGAGLFAAGLAQRGKEEGGEDEEVHPVRGPGATYAPGLRLAHNQITMSPRLIMFANRLRAAIPLSVVPELVINSGIRTAASQARAMLIVLQKGGVAYFKGLYKQAALELLALPRRDEATWTPKVAELYRRRILNPEGHYGGGALDIKATEFYLPIRELIERVALHLGAVQVLQETQPSRHIHIEIPLT